MYASPYKIIDRTSTTPGYRGRDLAGGLSPDIEVHGTTRPAEPHGQQPRPRHLHPERWRWVLLKNDFVAENLLRLHAYGSDADHKLDNFELDGFVSWSHSGSLPKAACGNGWDIFIGGAGTIRGFKVTNSGTWRTDANRSVSIGYFYSNVQNQTAFLRNDVFTGSEALWTWLTPLDSANVKLAPVGSVPASGQDAKVLINAYEPGRANVP